MWRRKGLPGDWGGARQGGGAGSPQAQPGGGARLPQSCWPQGSAQRAKWWEAWGEATSLRRRQNHVPLLRAFSQLSAAV